MRHRLNHGRAGSQTAGSLVWILAGWYWLERIFAFSGFNYWSTASKRRSANDGAAEDREELEDGKQRREQLLQRTSLQG
ncbi:unnamed protein product [Staurois parvus]|uniref:Uncharacterized protein n=1 Tax=Staurois parvus TaxID=386267 RepID=A0ABN9BXP6_9NEOB|nr:unnamed protein product [Staurois parvus]